MGRPAKNLKRVEAMLQPGEEVIAHVPGSYADPGHSAGTTRGTLTVANHRFIYSGTTPGAAKSIAYPWPQVTSILVHKT